MTTTIARPAYARTGTNPLTFFGLLRSEWIKLFSLRSTAWSYAILIVLTIGLAILLAYTTEPDADQLNAALTAATFGAFIGQLLVAVLGVLVITGEYSTGQIHSSLGAAPKRLPVLAAKAAVLFVVSFIVSGVSVLISYAIAASILSSRGAVAGFVVPEIIRPLAGTALYLALIAVFALGIGTIIRSTGGGVAAALGLILLLPVMFALIPVPWVNEAQAFLLTDAGLALSGAPSPLETWQQIVVTATWVLGSLGLGALLLTRRDA